MEAVTQVRYSVVIPLFNEQDNVLPLYSRVIQAMREVSDSYEIVFVDDGSRDQTLKVLSEICEEDPRVIVIRLRKNFGQTAALKAGFDFARGEVIISMDGDLQHDPAEIPAFVEKLNEDYNVFSGWRHERRDAWLTRQLPSRTANWLLARRCRVDLHDYLQGLPPRSDQGPATLRGIASFYSRIGKLVRCEHRGDSDQEFRAPKWKIELWAFPNHHGIAGSDLYQISSGLFREATAPFRKLGPIEHCRGRRGGFVSDL